MQKDKLTPREAVGLLLGAAAITLFIFGVSPTPFDALDFRSIFLPYQVYFKNSILAGDFPFWNPYASLGRPFAADPSAIAFWPLNLVYLGTNIFVGAIILTWFHITLSAWFSAKLCLRLGVTRTLALATGLAFAFSGKLMGHFQAGHLQFVFSYLYLPALLYLAKRVQDDRDSKAVAGLAFFSFLQFLAGAPQVYWNCALAVGFFLIGNHCEAPFAQNLRRLVSDTLRTLAAYALGLASSAALLVPTWELIGQSNRSSERVAFSADGSLGWHQWLSMFSLKVGSPFLVDWELIMYAGAAVAVVGLAGLTCVNDARVRGFVAVALGSGFIATSGNTPVAPFLVRYLPGYSSFHIHARTGAVLVYTFIVSAAMLLSDPKRRRSATIVACVGLGAILALLSVKPTLLSDPSNAAWSFRALLLLAISTASVCGYLLQRDGPRRKVWAAAATAALLVDMVSSDFTMKQTYVTARNYFGEEPLFEGLVHMGYMQTNRPPPRIFASPEVVRANAGMIYGFGTIAGSEDLALNRVWKYVHWAIGVNAPDMSDVYAWKYFLDKGSYPVPWVCQVGVVSPDTNSVEIMSKEPDRVWLNNSVRVVADWQEADGRLALGHDPRKSALVEAPFPYADQLDSQMRTGSASVTGFSRNTITVKTTSPGKALLVMAEAWYPGWTALINGKETNVIPANGWMRAVLVPAGNATVVLRYSPRHFGVGIAISIASLTTLLCLWRFPRAKLPVP